jgi:hypothetical protein
MCNAHTRSGGRGHVDHQSTSAGRHRLRRTAAGHRRTSLRPIRKVRSHSHYRPHPQSQISIPPKPIPVPLALFLFFKPRREEIFKMSDQRIAWTPWIPKDLRGYFSLLLPRGMTHVLCLHCTCTCSAAVLSKLFRAARIDNLPIQVYVLNWAGTVAYFYVLAHAPCRCACVCPSLSRKSHVLRSQNQH